MRFNWSTDIHVTRMELEMEGSLIDSSSIRKRYPDLKGKFISLVLDASPPPSSSSSSSPSPPVHPHHRVGLHLAGHKDPSRMSTFVVGVEPRSVADKDGTIIVGDELLEVNGQVIYGRSHLNSSAIIKSMNGPRLEMVIHRDSAALENMAVVPTSSCALIQKDLHQSLSTPVMVSSRENKGKQKMFHNSNNDNHSGSVDSGQQHAEKLSATFSFPGGMSRAPSPKTNATHPTSVQTPGRTIIDLSLPDQHTEHRHDNNRPQELAKEFKQTLEKHFSGEAMIVKGAKAKTPPIAVNSNSVLSTKEIADAAVTYAEKSMPTANGGATSNDDVNGASKCAASRQCSSLLPHSDSLASTDIPFDNEDDDDEDDDASDDLLNHHQEDVLSHHHHHHHHLLYHHNNETGTEMRDENPLKTCPVVAGGKAVLIEVDRNNLPVGVILIGGQDTAMKNVCVKEVLNGGAVEADGRLKLGDEILEINGEKVEHLPHSKIQQLMQKSSNSLRLLVRREPQSADLSMSFFYDSFTIEVFRKLGKGLGICLRSRTGDKGAVVSHIIRGGPAEADGRLSVGDEITTVNGQDIIEAKVLEIFELIKIMTGRISLRVIRLKRSLTAPLQSSSPSNSSLIGGFRKSFKRSKENNTEVTK